MRIFSGILGHVLGNRLQAGIGRGLIELIAIGTPVHTIQTKEPGILCEGASREVLEEFCKVGLSCIVILVTIVTQSPVVLDSVVPLGTIGQDGQALKELSCLGILFLIPILPMLQM